MELIYICTNYNNSNYTKKAITSLLQNVRHNLKIYVVDNASCAKNVAILKKIENDHNSIRVIYSKKNIGYFRGINLGLEALHRDFKSKNNWVLIGNNDLEFSYDFCDRLQNHLNQYKDYSVISPDIITLDGSHQNPHVIFSISKTREFFYDLYYSYYWLSVIIYKLAKIFSKISRRGDEDQWETSRVIYQGHGSCYLLTPRFFRFCKKLWAPTFMMYEEFFLSLQLKEVGEEIFYSPGIQVKHHCHAAVSDIPGKVFWKIAKESHREYRKYLKVWGKPNVK